MKDLKVGIRSMTQAVETLSGGQRQCVAVARAAAFAEHVVILDEPTAALGVKEGNMVLELIRRVRDKGLPVILISHNMPHVFEIADRIHVARLGKRAAVLNPKKISMSDTVAVMTGAMPPRPRSRLCPARKCLRAVERLRQPGTKCLKGIDPLLTPELLKALAEMGHGDEIVIADANFTATTLGRGKTVIHLPGVGVHAHVRGGAVAAAAGRGRGAAGGLHAGQRHAGRLPQRAAAPGAAAPGRSRLGRAGAGARRWNASPSTIGCSAPMPSC